MNWKLIRYIDEYAGIPLLQVLSLFRARSIHKSEIENKECRRILVMKFWGIGNLFMMLPALNALRSRYPESHIDLLTLQPNLKAASTLRIFRNIHVIDTHRGIGFIRSSFNVLRSLRMNDYDLVIDFEQFARFSAVLCAVSGIPESIGFCTEGQHRHCMYTMPVQYDDCIHVTQSYVLLARAAGAASGRGHAAQEVFPGDPSIVRTSGNILGRFGIEGRAIILHIGTSDNFAERRWPAASLRELSNLLTGRGDITVVLTGLHCEASIADEIMLSLRHRSRVINAVGFLDFAEYLSLIAESELVVSADTSAVHIASALGTPVIGLYGPNTPDLYGPWGESGLAIYKKLECSPCITNFNAKIHVCRHPAGKGACMARISAQEVFQKIEEVCLPQSAGEKRS
ncbi:MAG: glycosyltransferase family 9 protein [Nitrospirae bacterium]|nr:glycosyltransferase family 9 protein [Nitrospirota bacterium]